jgi:tripartite ATP-independent transporter DctP family solute receptor
MKKLSMLFAVLAVCIFFAPGWALAKITMKIGHGAPESTAVHSGWLKFKELVDARSNGEIIVEIYGNQQIGGDRELTEATQLGNITGCSVSTANAAPFNADFFVFDTPFLFRDRAHVYSTLDGEPGKVMLKSCEKVNIKGFGWMENGFRNLTNSRRPIHLPKDLEGIKLRVMENPIQLAAWKALGANPTPMAFGEVFTALQQKTVDGQENPMELIFNNKFYEVNRYVTITNHIYSPYVCLLNLDFWNELKPEQQQLLQTALDETVGYHRSLVTKSAEDAEAAIRKHGNEFVDLTPEELAQFKSQVASVLPMIKERVSPEVYALFIGQ